MKGTVYFRDTWYNNIFNGTNMTGKSCPNSRCHRLPPPVGITIHHKICSLLLFLQECNNIIRNVKHTNT